jgi:hypothetical protein
MERRPLPSAAELGISDREYDRILRERGIRLSDAPPPVAAAPGGLTARAWLMLVAIVVIAALLFGPRPAPDPEYAFLETFNGRPVTYSPCNVIQVAVYPEGGPPNAEELVRTAVARMRSATGLDIVVIGTFGGYAPNWNFESGAVRADDPISVSWQDGDAIADMTDHVAGLGGSRWIAGRNGTPRLVAGTIALSRDYYARLADRGDDAKALAILLHEFGHVFGLAHVDSRAELMYGDGSEVLTFGPGDREGLRLAGQGPCV